MKATQHLLHPAALRARLFRKPQTRSRKDGGFSMIEIMVAMAIIAILAMGIMPQFNKYFERAAVQNLSSVVDNAAMTVANDQSLTGKLRYLQANVTASVAGVNKTAAQTLTGSLITGTGANSAAAATVGDLGFKIVGTDTEAPNYKAIYCSQGNSSGLRIVAVGAAETC